MNLPNTIERILVRIEKGLIVALLSVMVGLSFLQVILRFFFSSGLLWADIFLRHLVLWVGFLGAAVATSQGHHFAIDLLKRFLPQGSKKAVFVLVHVFACFGLSLLAAAAVKFFKDELTSGSILFSIGDFPVPSFWMTAAIPVGFILLLFHFILRTFVGPPPDSSLEI